MKIGIDLGGSHIGVGLIEGVELKETADVFFTEEDRKDIENSILNHIDVLIHEVLNKTGIKMEEIISIGAACPGTVSNGKVTSWNLGLREFDLRAKLIEKYGKLVTVRNDGKCAALVEKKYGAMKDYEDCVFVNIGTGLGGAAFLGGKLLEPKRYSGFEFGHMTLVKDGIPCTCGKKGCFERYASIKSLKQRITKTLNLDSADISGQYMREHLMVEYHDQVQDDINDFLTYLRIGICNLIDIFEPEVICFGGSFSYYEGHPVLNKLIEEINKPEMTFNDGEKPKIVTAFFKNDAGIIGATIDN